MKTIKEFEEAVCKYNKNNIYRNFLQIAYDPSYYDVFTTFDTELELDLFTLKQDTMKALVNYLDSIKVIFLKPDYIPNLSKDLKRLFPIMNNDAKKLYDSACKLNGKCNEKYMFDNNIKKYRTQIKISGKKIKTLYDFLSYAKQDIMEISKEYNDEIELCPYQIDGFVDGSIIYSKGKQIRKQLKFCFDTGCKRTSYVSACMLKQTARNQAEFDELNFILI